jgi:hypothetical protein
VLICLMLYVLIFSPISSIPYPASHYSRSKLTQNRSPQVLLARNHTDLVQKGRLLNPSSKSNGGKVTQLGRAITKPLSSKLSTDGIIRYVLTLPLNFIPVVGTVFFLGTSPSCKCTGRD